MRIRKEQSRKQRRKPQQYNKNGIRIESDRPPKFLQAIRAEKEARE